MSAKHSPDPWLALPYDEGRSYGHPDWARFSIHSGGPFSYEIAAIIGDVSQIPAEANARLIAAAPDLLDALQSLDDYWTEDFPEGPDGSRVALGGLGTIADDTIAVWRKVRDAISKAEGRS